MTADHTHRSPRRLFARSLIPIRVIVAGHRLAVKNWSLGGLSIAKPAPVKAEIGRRLPSQLVVNLGGVDLTLKVTLRLVYENDDRFGFAFEGLTSEQTGVLRALMVRSGGIPLERIPLGSPSETPSTGLPSLLQPSKRRSRRRKWPMGPIGWGAALIALGLLGAGALLLMPKATESVHAAVAVRASTLAAPERGYVDQILIKPGDSIREKETVLTIRRRAEPSSVVKVASPCTCKVLDILPRNGDELLPGQEVAFLANWNDSDLIVEALVAPKTEVAVGREVEVLIEELESPAHGLIAAVDPNRHASDVFGLPAFLRMDPRYRLIVIENLKGVEGAQPGAAARLRFSDRDAMQQRLHAALNNFIRFE